MALSVPSEWGVRIEEGDRLLRYSTRRRRGDRQELCEIEHLHIDFRLALL